MAIVVKLANKNLEEQGTEPVCNAEQEAPIVGKDVEWKEEGTINDGHEEAQPKGEVPKKQTANECGDSGACGLPEKPPIDNSGTGAESNLTIPDLPDVPPVDAYEDDLPWHESDADGQGADAPPPPTGTTEAEQAQSDQQAEDEVSDKAEEGQKQEPEGEALEEPTQNVAVNEDQQMMSQGKLVSQDHKTTTHEVPAPSDTTGHVAKVRYSCGFTKNIGEFNSMRAEVSVELPCDANDEAIDAAYNKAVELVDSRLQVLYDATDVQQAPPQAQEQVKPQTPDLPMAPPPPPAQ